MKPVGHINDERKPQIYEGKEKKSIRKNQKLDFSTNKPVFVLSSYTRETIKRIFFKSVFFRILSKIM